MPPLTPFGFNLYSRGVRITAFIGILLCQLFAIQLLLTADSCSGYYQSRYQHKSSKVQEAEYPPVNETTAQTVTPAQNDPKPENPAVPRDEILWSVPSAGKKVALTFDDGPSKNYTLKYLDLLREKQVKATFFLIGRNVLMNPALTSLIAGEGHEIANHTYDHYIKRMSEAVIKEQISRTSHLLKEWTQQEIKYVRPPGGNNRIKMKAVASQLDMQVVMWSVDPKDWKENATPAEIIASIKKQLTPGAIIVLHEGKPQTLEALPVLIDELRQDGWEFVTISELLCSS